LKQVFDHFDSNQNGKIEKTEIKKAFSELGQDISDHEIAKIVIL